MNYPSNREKQIFTEAEGIADPRQQNQFLDRACDGDKDLRVRLQRLLEAHGQAGDFIPMDPAAETKTVEVPALTEGEGSVIGRYKLLQNIGEGGCGIVYMAEQQQPVVRRVALKIIKLGMDTKQVIARFEAERQALAMMDHPNIAKVFDAGATDTGRPYFVMELVRGIPITEFCDQQQSSTLGRLTLFMDVCSAIQHAHQKGVIHRDIKPSNILVTMHDHKAVPKIIDFGIAKATQQRLTDKTLFTQFHQFIGTPAYMSPEQAQMSGLDIDTRTDIYSLGVLLYELLTGRTPLNAEELTQGDYDEMRRRIREEDPIYPSTQLSTMNHVELTTIAQRRNTEATRLNRMMRGDLDWIVMKALEKDRNRRYETAVELAMDVQRYLNLEPVKAAAPSGLYRFRKFARRNRGALSAAAAILLLLSVGSVISTSLAIKANIAAKAAKSFAEESRDAQKLAEEREKDANKQRNLVIKSERALRQNLYASDMYQAQHFLREDNIAKSLELLSKYIPKDDGDEDLRGFEWQYLWERSLGDELYVFEGHSQPVGAVAFSPDGSLLASLSSDGKLGVWNAFTHRSVALIDTQLESNPLELRLQFSADGKALFAGRTGSRRGSHRHISVWNTSDWTLAARFEKASFPLFQRERSTQFFASTGDGFRMFDWGQGVDAPVEASATSLAHKSIGRYALSHDGNLMALKGRSDAGLSVYDVQTGSKLIDWPHASSTNTRLLSVANGMQYLAWMPDDWWGSGSNSGHLRLFNPFEEREIELQHSQPGVLIAAEFSPDTSWLVAGGWDYLLHVWDPSSGDWVGAFKGHLDEIFSLAFSPNSQSLASGSKDGRVYLWDMRSLESLPDMEPLTFRGPASEGQQEALLTIKNQQALSALYPPSLWLELEKKNLKCFVPPKFSRQGFRVSPGGGFAALPNSSSNGNGYEIFDLATGRFKASVMAVSSRYRRTPMFISEDKFLYQKEEDVLHLWDLAENRDEVVDIPTAYGSFRGASGNGNLLAFSGGGDAEEIVIWDLEKKKEISILRGMNQRAMSLVFSDDGSLAIATGWDKRGFVWDTASGEVVRELTGHKQGVFAAAFTSDGKTISTCSPDGMIRIWHLETGREVLTFTPDGVGNNKLLYSLRFSKDGQILLVIGYDTSWILRVPSLDQIDLELATTTAIEQKS